MDGSTQQNSALVERMAGTTRLLKEETRARYRRAFGSELARQSGKTLEEIVHTVKRVTDIIAEISAASQEQASGIDQVNKAISSMDETTQQNAALVEKATSAAHSMKDQAKELTRQMEVLRISGAGSFSQRAAPVSPRSHGRAVPSVSKQGRAKGGDATKGAGSQQELVGVAARNGKDRRRAGGEFEEF